MISSGRFNLLNSESLMNGAMPLPQNKGRANNILLSVAAERLVRVPHNHILVRIETHFRAGVPAQMLVRKEQHLSTLCKRPFNCFRCIRAGANGAVFFSD